jgi:hypothetical protein
MEVGAKSTLARLGVAAGYTSCAKRAAVLGCSEFHLRQVELGRNGASKGLIARMAGLYHVSRETIAQAIEEIANERKKIVKSS